MQSTAAMVVWLVSEMLRWTLPPHMHTEEAAERYENIALSALRVAFDPKEEPLFKEAGGRSRTAVTLLAIASYESDFRADVDSGRVRGDAGRSWCLMQINLGGGGKIQMRGDGYGYGAPGWTGKDLTEDREKCFRAGLHIARDSLRQCGNLSKFTSGHCFRGGEYQANRRMARANALWKNAAEDVHDMDVLDWFAYAWGTL